MIENEYVTCGNVTGMLHMYTIVLSVVVKYSISYKNEKDSKNNF